MLYICNTAISGISPEYYEAAVLDGANRFQRMRYITLLCISSTIVVLLILKIGTILDAGLDQVYMLYNSSVYNVGDILDTYIYRVAWRRDALPSHRCRQWHV